MLPIGIMVNNLERDRLKGFAVAASHGFKVVHTNAIAESWLTGPQRQAYLAAAQASGLTIDTMFIGFDGQSYADIPTIRRTVGLVPEATRTHRLGIARQYCDLAAELGVRQLALHAGMLPHDPSDPEFQTVASMLRDLADEAAHRQQSIHLETGQEPATVLLQFLRTVGRENVHVNFDTGNFILYGTDDPVAALDQLLPQVRGIHCKDGRWPLDSGSLGAETPLGQGQVDFTSILTRLLNHGYGGPLILEREHGPSVVQDVQNARTYLEQLQARLLSRASTQADSSGCST